MTKVVSPNALHKIDIGCIALNLKDEHNVRESFTRLNSPKIPQARIQGVILYPFQTSGFEVLAGMTLDAQFGPVITFGTGGVWVEALNDLTYGIASLSPEEAEEMIHSIRGYSLLGGARGKNPFDRRALCGLLVRLSRMALKEETIQEIDLNPVFSLEQSFFIADARILLALR